ncbi:PREDICTED: methionine-R-sulfoxide reductase B1 isoform X2 [Rhagoletis zephyria]|uniref:methionine-R-sulfoxide reductase B1 isoform X2 n=1 Tax=Rhagoletis zephyria TaxID=28612 RepID=UPI0008115B6B|nr:PREDICTED: methionine-R-sulfoxide reductase B1 isoform X2 [Rhagoletis zephyria]
MFSLIRNITPRRIQFATIALRLANVHHIPVVKPSASIAGASAFINQRNFTDKPQNQAAENSLKDTKMENKAEKVNVNKEELKKRLTPLQYQVTQEAATERPFTGCYNKHYEKGIYRCIVCQQDLFSSDTKYDSGCGWPAFNDVLDKGKITLHRDASIPVISKMLGMVRTEVRCSKCTAHMGHVFDDGPPPKHLRYCINSASIDFVPIKNNSNNASGSSATSASFSKGNAKK